MSHVANSHGNAPSIGKPRLRFPRYVVGIEPEGAKGHVELAGITWSDCRSGFEILNVTWSHALLAAGLPRTIRIPFDRLLIGQAVSEGFTIFSRDMRFAQYESHCSRLTPYSGMLPCSPRTPGVSSRICATGAW